MNEEQERRLTELRTRNLAPVAKVRRGLRVDNSATSTEMYFYDDIGGWDGIVAKDVVSALASQGGRPIDLHINSGGGDIFEAHAIHNALRRYKGTVTGYVDGIAASAASYILMACDAAWMEPNAQLMIHDGQGLCMGPAADMRETADLLDLLSDSIAGMYAARAGGTTEEWRAKMQATTWFNASQAVSAKLASGIRADDPATTNQLVADQADAVGTAEGWRAGLTVVPIDGAPIAGDPLVGEPGVTPVITVTNDLPPDWFGGLSTGLKGLFS
jgi:ATP-dependent protease ClpP protease subunit